MIPAVASDNALYTVSAVVAATAGGDFSLRDLPDLILVSNGTTAATIQLPKIGSQFAPVGKRFSIRKQNAGATSAVTIARFTGDTINGAAADNTTALPTTAKNDVTLQATSLTNWDIVASSVVAI